MNRVVGGLVITSVSMIVSVLVFLCVLVLVIVLLDHSGVRIPYLSDWVFDKLWNRGYQPESPTVMPPPYMEEDVAVPEEMEEDN